jgi:hypothetical protein
LVLFFLRPNASLLTVRAQAPTPIPMSKGSQYSDKGMSNFKTYVSAKISMTEPRSTGDRHKHFFLHLKT